MIFKIIFSTEHLFDIVISSNFLNIEQFEEVLKISVYESDPTKSQIKSIQIININNINELINKLINVKLNYINLTHLNLRDCCDLTDQSIIAITNSSYMKNLTSLNLSWVPNLTDQSIIAIANSPHMSNITSLNLSYIPITDQSITYLRNRHPKIRIYNNNYR